MNVGSQKSFVVFQAIWNNKMNDFRQVTTEILDVTHLKTRSEHDTFSQHNIHMQYAYTYFVLTIFSLGMNNSAHFLPPREQRNYRSQMIDNILPEEQPKMGHPGRNPKHSVFCYVRDKGEEQ
ncbi:hypothetical protein EGR_04389 [Echinococcus granulosus]|uniref:Uncharacterized protein n=1 Tax=Echinococcus granulosus TaxID=6210 RepID=W6UI74_ECHGR|nr:hypothetical protein EGR_04389 [Echinococcus granulosus]EUB60763.1 hypothetical protein EGR_04389 [Echinococcus granulosus]